MFKTRLIKCIISNWHEMPKRERTVTKVHCITWSCVSSSNQVRELEIEHNGDGIEMHFGTRDVNEPLKLIAFRNSKWTREFLSK